jgi:polyribonucleotide nucleotidyltransferase
VSKKVQVSTEIAGRTLTMTTGQLAKQASGSILLQYADTSIFIACQTGPSRPGTDFFPLTVDYRERFAAAGKFPGGFLKREGRPTQKEILTCRLTDRPIRPLFPKTFRDEVQINMNVMSSDGENDPGVWAITGGSAACMVSPIPYQGPIAAVRVGLIDDEFVLFPTVEQMKESELDLVMAGSKDSTLMIEGFGNQIPEDQMVDALLFGQETIVEICKLQEELVELAGIEPFEYDEPEENPWLKTVEKEAGDKIKKAVQKNQKTERSAASKEVRTELVNKYFDEDETELEDGRTLDDLKEAFYLVHKDVCRKLTLSGKRLDGRGPEDLRQIDCEVDILPVVHGSAVFTRGETQSLATVVLGTVRDEQRVDGLFDEVAQNFYLHYNFPSFSVGECRPNRGPGRREIGHGALAERSVAPVLPKKEDFPYTIRIISDILESNGSSSMASVCSATLGLMAAGVPISQPVAGISIGVVTDGEDYTILTDIIGDEDHFGDMDFKVAGSQKGITGIQLDLKIDGINEEIIRKTLEQAKNARREILKNILTTIRRPRPELPDSAPRIISTKINPEKIGLVIGPSGKTIRAIQDSTGAQIDIVDDGTITISGPSKDVCAGALAHIEALTEEIKVGRIYNGKVSSIKDFGAFVEIAPGKDGLLHISELSDGFVKSVTDVVKIGEQIDVKVIAVDDQNRVKLSRKAVLAEKGLTDQKPEESDSDDDNDDYDGEEE